MGDGGVGSRNGGPFGVEYPTRVGARKYPWTSGRYSVWVRQGSLHQEGMYG